jgi:hypothetical protein
MPLSTIFKLYNVLWQSVLLVEETGVPGENLRPAAKSLSFIHIAEEKLGHNK